MSEPAVEGIEEPNLRDWIDAQPTREAWLTERLFLDVMPHVKGCGLGFPTNIRVGCGWAGTGHDACTLGICYAAATSKDRSIEIFVSPALDDAEQVMGALWHEIAHAIAGVDAQHSDRYGMVCSNLGLTQLGIDGNGTWPEQAWPGVKLTDYIKQGLETADPYPHASLTPLPPAPPKVIAVPVPQSTRTHKAVCPDCGYAIRLTMKWIMRGLPTCTGCNKLFALANVLPVDEATP